MSQSRSLKQAKRNYKLETKNYQSRPEQIHNRSLRNQARREMMKEGRVQKGDGNDVDHKTPLIKGGSNRDNNLRVRTSHVNRSFPRTKRAGMK